MIILLAPSPDNLCYFYRVSNQCNLVEKIDPSLDYGKVTKKQFFTKFGLGELNSFLSWVWIQHQVQTKLTQKSGSGANSGFGFSSKHQFFIILSEQYCPAEVCI